MKQQTINTTLSQEALYNNETQLIEIPQFGIRPYFLVFGYTFGDLYYRRKYIIAYMLFALICLSVLYWVIQKPTQNQFLAQELNTIPMRIRDIEINPQGKQFRWLSDSVSIMAPKPTAQGIVTLNVWKAPQRIATAIQIGNYQLSLPEMAALQPRRLAILATSTATSSTLLPITFRFAPNETNDPIAWAFESVYWESTLTPSTPQQILLLCIFITLIIGTGTCYRISGRFYVSLCVATIGILIVLFAQSSISVLVGWVTNQPMLYKHLWVLALMWVLWYWKYPFIRAFMRKAKAQTRIMLFMYGTLTLIPVIGMIAPPESPDMRIEELRKLQACPSQWTGAIWDVAANFTPLAQCVTDNIGWRNTLIRIKNEIDYQVFGVSSRIYFGHNDFYFMRRWTDDRLPWLNEIFHAPTQRQKLLTTLQQINQQYASHGVHVIMVIAPSKEFMYPENLPWNAPRYDYQLVRDLEHDMATSGIDVIHTYDLLQAHKKDVPLLYHPRDFHWNDLAAYYVAREITNRVAQHQNVSSPWQHPLDPCTMFRKASDQTFAALLTNRNAYASTYCQTTTMPNDVPWIVEQRFNRDFNVWRAAPPSPTQELGAIEINGDSYSMYFQTSGFERYFNLVTITQFKNWRDAFSPEHLEYLQQNNIRYVVWQMRDASLPLLLNDIYTEY